MKVGPGEREKIAAHLTDTYAKAKGQNSLWKIFGLHATGHAPEPPTESGDKMDLLLEMVQSLAKNQSGPDTPSLRFSDRLNAQIAGDIFETLDRAQAKKEFMMHLALVGGVYIETADSVLIQCRHPIPCGEVERARDLAAKAFPQKISLCRLEIGKCIRVIQHPATSSRRSLSSAVRSIWRMRSRVRR